ncbi:colicin V family bacteriocin, partial [Escherichia coli]|uniref:colicin V family bacteriocin n=1 Tax=Escherichia coli TaxID=562 RepID=UPI0020231D6C
MRTLTLNELDSVSGGASGRDIAMAIGTLSGQFVAGGVGASAGGVAGGAIYDYASTHKPNPAMSPSGLGGTIKQKWICPYISRHLLSLNPLLACCRRYSR